MKRFVGLVLFTSIFCICLGNRIIKDPRDFIYSLLSDTSIVWERDDNYFGCIDIIFNYPKQMKVLKIKIEYGTKWSKYYNKLVDDTIVTCRGINHTWSVWTKRVDFDIFYNGYDYREE